MRRTTIKGVAAVFILLGAVACSDKDKTPVRPPSVEVALKFTYDLELLSYTKAANEDSHELRYQLYLFDEEGKLINRKVQCTDLNKTGRIDIGAKYTLTPAKYRITVWVDHVLKSTEAADTYYTTADIGNITVCDPYIGSTEMKDAFYATDEIDLSGYRSAKTSTVEHEIRVGRPFGIYRIVTTDLDKYLASRGEPLGGPVAAEYTTVINYSAYFPVSYNINTGKPNDAVTGISFRSAPAEMGNGEVLLGFDYVFVNGNESAVTVDLDILNSDDGIINQAGGLNVPIKRGHLTTIRGEFLTGDFAPGVTIDPGYDGNIDITLPD